MNARPYIIIKNALGRTEMESASDPETIKLYYEKLLTHGRFYSTGGRFSFSLIIQDEGKPTTWYTDKILPEHILIMSKIKNHVGNNDPTIQKSPADP